MALLSKFDIANFSVEDREEHFAEVRRECVDHRASTNREQVWRDIWMFFRNLADRTSPYKNTIVSTYLWTALYSQVAVLEPIFFTGSPIYDLRSPRDEDYDSNVLWEQLLTQQVQFQPGFRTEFAASLIEALVFGGTYPWTQFQTVSKIIPSVQPLTDSMGMPVMGPDGRPMMVTAGIPARTYHGPSLLHVDLWDSFIHPDGIRGFSMRDITGRDLLRASAPGGRYNRQSVLRCLKAAARNIQAANAGTGASMRREEDYVPGDDSLVERDFLALEAGTESGMRLDSYIKGYVKDVLAMKFPVLHYDDGSVTGSYLLNKDGKLKELRFHPFSAPDGGTHRMELKPYPAGSKEVYGVGLGEVALPMLKAHSRFFQLAMDGAELTVHPQWAVSHQFSQMMGELFTGPGVINVAPPGGGKPSDHIERMDMPQSWANALQYRDNIERELEQLFAQADFARGQISSGRRTASELNLVAEYGNARLQLLGDRIAHQFAAPLGLKWLCMDSLYLMPDDIVAALGVKATDQMGMPLRIPPPEILLRTMQVVFKGSVTASNQQVMLSRYAQLAPHYERALPYLQVPWVQEYFRRWMEIAGMESVSKQFPPADPMMATAMQMMLLQKAGGAGPGNTGPDGSGPARPSSPTDLVGLMRQGGGTAGGENAPQPDETGGY